MYLNLEDVQRKVLITFGHENSFSTGTKGDKDKEKDDSSVLMPNAEGIRNKDGHHM